MRKLLLFASVLCMAVSYGGCAEVEVTEPSGQGTEEGTGGEQGGGETDTPSGDIPEGFEEEPDDPTSDFNITFDYSVLSKAGHPRLLIDKAGFDDLKAKVTTGRFTYRTLYKLHQEVLSRAQQIVATVPDKLHPSDFYVDGFATIDEVIDAGGRQGAVLDMSGPMKGQVSRATRTIELVDGSGLVVTDEITALADLDCELEWRMLSITSSTVTDDGITLTKDGRTRTLVMTSSDPTVTPEYKKWSTVRPSEWTPRDWDQAISDRTIVGWSVTVPAGRTVRFVTELTAD